MQKSRKTNFKKKPANNLNYLLNFNYDEHYEDFRSPSLANKAKSRSRAHRLKPKVADVYTDNRLSPLQKTLAKYNFGLVEIPKGLTDTTCNQNLIWQNIFLVHAQENGEKCSICLDSFVYPRITKCGHIYCTVCLDRLLVHEQNNLKQINTSQKVWLSCPLCLSMFLAQECKRIKFFQALIDVKPGDIIDFKLFSGTKKNFLYDVSGQNQHQKFFKVPREDMISLLDAEVQKFKQMRTMAKDAMDTEHEFHVNRILGNLEQELPLILKEVSKEDSFPSCFQTKIGDPIVSFYACPKQLFNVFLDPFNLQCLERQSKEELPKILKNVRVLEVTRYNSISAQFLKKYTYLQHLLPGSDVCFVEVALGNYISKETKEFFRKEIFRRKQLRLKKKQLKRTVQRKEIVGRSIKEDFKNQLLAIQAASGASSFRAGTEDMSDDLKAFLRTSCEDTSCQLSCESGSPVMSVTSFATIVDKNGYFPALGLAETSKVKEPLVVQHATCINRQQTSPVVKNPKSSKLTSCRRSGRKHRVELFSNSSGRRRYS